MKINSEVRLETVTPEIAAKWLENVMPGQRKLRPNYVDRLASDMMSNRWRLGTDAILIVGGYLANGQHRMTAVIKSGRPQKFIVMESNDSDLYKVIDSNLVRTVGDRLEMPYAHDLPSIARLVMAYDCGSIGQSVTAPSNSRQRVSQTIQTSSAMVDYCNEHRELLVEAASYVTPLHSKTRVMRKSLAGAVYVIGTRAGKLDRARAFLRAVYLTGSEDVAGALRNRLIANHVTRAKLPFGYLIGLTIRAFAIYCSGDPYSRLEWKNNSSLPRI